MNITTKNFELTESIESFVHAKFEKITDKFNGVQIKKINLSVIKNEHKAEAILNVAGKTLTMESVNEDLYIAITLLVDKLSYQVRKQLDKAQRRDNDSIRFSPNKTKGDVIMEQEKKPIVKRKQFNMKPMGEEEALLQMEMLGHSFFFFFNADTESMCTLYKRKDGNYGLIESNF